MTVRTCTNDIVQFTYGGDSLDPVIIKHLFKMLSFRRLENLIIRGLLRFVFLFTIIYIFLRLIWKEKINQSISKEFIPIQL